MQVKRSVLRWVVKMMVQVGPCCSTLAKESQQLRLLAVLIAVLCACKRVNISSK